MDVVISRSLVNYQIEIIAVAVSKLAGSDS
jgi:hypothetical protein